MTQSPAKTRSKNSRKGLLPFSEQHGGCRAGAGRKPKGDKAGIRHRERSALASRFPVHVTVKLSRGLPRLRSKREYAALRTAFAAGCDRSGFRLTHYAVLDDHLHFLVAAADRRPLARGVQGLVLRMARALHKLWQRRGKVFADRYHDHILRSPREVRNALRYVLANARKHAAEGREVAVPQAIDTFDVSLCESPQLVRCRDGSEDPKDWSMLDVSPGPEFVAAAALRGKDVVVRRFRLPVR